MKLDVLFISVLITFGSLLLILIGLVIRKNMRTPEIRTLGFLFGTNAFYFFGYAFELLAVSPELKLIFNHIQYLGLPFIVPVWLILCLRFCKKWYKGKWKPVLLLFLIPVVTLIFNFTHTLNGAFYSSYKVSQWGGFNVLVFTKGFWYYVEAANKTILMSLSIWLYAKMLAASTGIRKKQAGYLLILSIFGLAFSALSMFSITTAYVDFICILLSISFVLMAVTLFKYDLFDLVPLAYSKLFDVLDQPILILSDSLTVVKANTEAKRVFDGSVNTHRPTQLRDLFDGEENNGDGTKQEGYLFKKMPDGQLRYYSVNMIKLASESSDGGEGYLAVLTDSTSHIEQIRVLETLAAGDPLTGLYNRRYFFSAAGEMLLSAKECGGEASLVILDIDHFKNINDEYGHQTGDLVLRSVSETISQQLRSYDVLARLGGDEFVLMLKNSDLASAEAVVNRICSSVREKKYVFEKRRIRLTLSAGIGGGDSAGFRNIDELLTLADSALYDAKSNGRNRVCVNRQSIG